MTQFERVPIEGDINYIARFSDGELVSLSNAHPELIENLDRVRPERRVLIRRSTDDGRTWTEPAPALAFESGVGFATPVASVVDHNDRLHLFGLRFYEIGWPAGPWHSDLNHAMSDDRGVTWTGTRAIDFGHRYTGSINNVTVLDSGRILLPLSFVDPSRISGLFVSRCVFSDDGGETWEYSNEVPVEGGGNFPESGSLEPVVVQLNSGLVWMIIRTVNGYFWESFSNDGRWWTPARSTRIVSCNAPAGVVRMSNGDLVMAWNNRYGVPMKEHGISYARDRLSMAISKDDGQTWSVPKIIASIGDQDPSDVQTTYPYLFEANDGSILCVYHEIRKNDGRNWHDPIRHLLRIEPSWLTSRD